MIKRLSAAALLSLGVILSGCAHESGAYFSGSGFPDECELGGDCYAGPQYTCVFYGPASLPARLEIDVARHSRFTRIVNPRDSGPGMPPPDSGGSASASASAPAPAPAMPAREPVILVSPPTDGRIPHGGN